MTDISLRYLLFGEDKTATSTITKVGGAFSKVGSHIGGEFGEILNRVGEGIDHIGEHAKTMGAKLTGVGAVVGGVGVAFQLAGSREAQGAAQLNAAIDATGRAHEDYAKGVEEAIKSNEKFGFGAADTQQALARLTAATNDPQKALDSMGLAANLAASQHIGLADASKMLARIMSGTGGRVLAQYGIQMDKNVSKTQAGKKAADELAQKLRGQAAAGVDSFGGKIRVLQTRIGDMTAQIGQKFGPVLMGVGTILEIYKARQLAAAAATDAEVGAESRGIIVKGLTLVRTAAVTVATAAWTAAQWALNVAMDANPIALIIIGIVALIAVIILAYKHSATFRAIVQAAFHGVAVAAVAAVAAIKVAWGAVFNYVIAPVGRAAVWVAGRVAAIVGFFRSAPGRIGSALASVASAITSPFRSAFNYIADAWNNTIGQLHWSIPSWVPGIGGNSISVPRLPHFAAGVSGVITRPGMFMAGEAGAEAISITPLSAGRGASQGGGNVYLTNNFYGPVDKAAVGKQVVETLVEYQRQQRRPLPLSVAGAIG